jgi:hypothetical protein
MLRLVWQKRSEPCEGLPIPRTSVPIFRFHFRGSSEGELTGWNSYHPPFDIRLTDGREFTWGGMDVKQIPEVELIYQ